VNKAEAKREANFRAAMVIESALEGGWRELDRYGKDREKVEDQPNDLAARLVARSGRTPHPDLPEG
jgi:hypothetical protein